MIRVGNIELLHRLHMTYWIGGRDCGPRMSEILEGDVWYDPSNGTVWFENMFLLSVDVHGSLALEMIRDGLSRWDVGVPLRRGSIVWLDLEDGSSGAGMCLGEGVWLMEDGLEVWFWEIVGWKGVEISQV